MKRSLLLTGVVLLGMSLSSAAMAENFAKKGNTTCYVFKNDKLSNKASCLYRGYGEYTGNGGNFNVDFKLKGVKGVTKVNLSGTTWSGYEYKLNGKVASELYRSKSNLKKLTNAQTEQLWENDDDSNNVLLCLKDARGNEFCYADINILGV